MAKSVIGKTLNQYEVLESLGEGGMGEVYRARDTKLARDVAIKVLPAHLADDPERLARMQREAQLLAALNHPNIAAIYGLEEAGGVSFLAMELAEGRTLGHRLQDGALGVDEALEIALQIAEALEAAHERGIVHQDLTPANVHVDTPADGLQVKVLDFGLAKGLESGGGATGTTDLSMSPTVLGVTQAGVIMGTAGYMSPEQARGKPVDRRADIWAFGVVLYEMRTGRSAFGGETVSDVLANVIKEEPDLGALPAGVPPPIRRLLQRCLRKDPRQRLRDIGDARVEIDDLDAADVPSGAAEGASGRSGSWIPVVAASVLALLLGGLAGSSLPRSEGAAPPTVSFRLALPPGDTLVAPRGGRTLALSPDGTRVVYVASRDGVEQLFLRRLDELEPTAIPDTEGARSPFFSPDGEWLAYRHSADGRLVKRLASGQGQTITISTAGGSGGVWNEDGNIIFGEFRFGSEGGGLRRVSAAGGEVEVLTSPSDTALYHGLPQLLPDGEAVVFFIDRGSEDMIAVVELATGEVRDLVPGQAAVYADTGHLLVSRGGALSAVPFDAASRMVTGEAVPVLDGVHWTTAGGPLSYALGSNGTLAYVTWRPLSPPRQAAWVDREGAQQALEIEPGSIDGLRLSPDGGRVAFSHGGNIQVHDLARGTTTAVTDGRQDGAPTWSPDGRQRAFRRWETNAYKMFVASADGTGEAERLLESRIFQFPLFYTPDGDHLIFRHGWLSDVSLRRLSLVDGDVSVLLPLDDGVWPQATLSPDGRFIAYASYETGRAEVYVRPFPEVESARWLISTAGGVAPQWVATGDELFYRSDAGIMTASVSTVGDFTAGRPQMRVELDQPPVDANWFRGAFSISPDGERVLIDLELPTTVATESQALVVMTGWREELLRQLRANR